MTALILVAAGFLVLWFAVVLPQRRAQRTKMEMQESIEAGDEIVTAGGLYGEVLEVGDDELSVEIAEGVVVRVATRAIAGVIGADEEDDDAFEDEEPDAPPATVDS